MSKTTKSVFFQRKRNVLLSLLLAVLILAGFGYACDIVSDGNIHRQKKYLVMSLEHYITDCYASKGYYPVSLNYLRENYGLSYNDDLFYVDYQVRGANIRPDVVVIELTDPNS